MPSARSEQSSDTCFARAGAGKRVLLRSRETCTPQGGRLCRPMRRRRGGGGAEAAPVRVERPRAAAYTHSRVLDEVAEEGESRVIVVMGDPSLPEARARDWR